MSALLYGRVWRYLLAVTFIHVLGAPWTKALLLVVLVVLGIEEARDTT
jgi:hypothetical protein